MSDTIKNNLGFAGYIVMILLAVFGAGTMIEDCYGMVTEDEHRQLLLVVVSDSDSDGRTIPGVQAYLDSVGGVMRVGGAWAWLLHTNKTPEDIRDEMRGRNVVGANDKVLVVIVREDERDGLLTPDDWSWMSRRKVR